MPNPPKLDDASSQPGAKLGAKDSSPGSALDAREAAVLKQLLEERNLDRVIDVLGQITGPLIDLRGGELGRHQSDHGTVRIHQWSAAVARLQRHRNLARR